MENGSSVNSDYFEATDLRFQSVGKVKFKAHWQKANVREYTRRCNTVENIHEVIVPRGERRLLAVFSEAQSKSLQGIGDRTRQ